MKVKPNTWNNYIRHLRSLYYFGIRFGFIHNHCNPFCKTLVRPNKGVSKRLTYLELIAIDNVMKRNKKLPNYLKPAWFSRVLIYTLKYTGIRARSLLNLTLENLDLVNETIEIKSDYSKNHTYQNIPIPKKILPYLKRLHKEHKKIKSIPSEQLFNINLFAKMNKEKPRMTSEQLSYFFRKLSHLTNVTISPHRFRHTLATELMKDPRNIYIVKQLLGHSDIKTTIQYIEYDTSLVRSSIDNIDF